MNIETAGLIWAIIFYITLSIIRRGDEPYKNDSEKRDIFHHGFENGIKATELSFIIAVVFISIIYLIF